MLWLWLFISGLILVIVLLLIKIHLLRKSAKEIECSFAEKLITDSNTLIDISSNDKYMCHLANEINIQLRKLRAERRKFQKGDILLLQNEINKIDYIIEKAYEKGMCIILNPSPYNDKIKKIDFNMLSYIIINEVEMSELTQCDNPKDGLKYFAKNYPKLKIIITLGSEGSMYGDTEKVVFQLSFKVNAVDTTAAGDTFTGYFFAQIAMGNTVEKSLKIASVASAITVSRKGASVSIPMLNEVLATENLLPNS